MSARKVFSLIGIILSVLLIVCLFLPFLNAYGETYSLWEYLDKSHAGITGIIIIVELVIAMIAYILQLSGVSKDAKLAYLGLGYYFTYHLSLFTSALSNEAFSELSFGFWIGLILSLVTVILTFIGSFVNNDSKPRMNSYSGGNSAPISGYDPETGKPIYAKPKGFDPQTGKPIYE